MSHSHRLAKPSTPVNKGTLLLPLLLREDSPKPKTSRDRVYDLLPIYNHLLLLGQDSTLGSLVNTWASSICLMKTMTCGWQLWKLGCGPELRLFFFSLCVLCSDCNYMNKNIFQRYQKSRDPLIHLCRVRLLLFLFVFHVSVGGLTAR